MKTILYICTTIVLVLVPWLVYGQNQSIRYNERYALDSLRSTYPDGLGAYFTHNYCYVAMRSSDSIIGAEKFFGVRVNLNTGVLEKYAEYGSVVGDTVYARSTSVEGFDEGTIYSLLRVNRFDSTTSYHTLSLIKVDSSLSHVDTINIQDTNKFAIVLKIIPYHEPGKFIAAGDVHDSVPIQDHENWLTLWVFDTNGVVYEKRRYEQPGKKDYSAAYDIVAVDNNGYAIVGSGGNEDVFGVVLPLFMEVDSNLNVVQWRGYTQESVKNLPFYSISATSDSNFLLGGAFPYKSDPTFLPNERLPYVLKIQPNGDTLWSFKPEGYKKQRSTLISEVQELKDGNYLGVGHYFYWPLPVNELESGNYGYVCKLTPEGELIWQRKLAHPLKQTSDDEHYLYDFTEMPNGDLVFVGDGVVRDPYPDGNGKQLLWIVRTDSMGCTIPDCHLAVPSSLGDYQTQIEVWPNPAQSVLNLQQVGNQNPSYENILRIYNLQGRLVQEVPFAEYFMSLNISNLASGAYVYTYNGASGKFVKE